MRLNKILNLGLCASALLAFEGAHASEVQEEALIYSVKQQASDVPSAFERLPREIKSEILNQPVLSIQDLSHCAQVSNSIREVSQTALWKVHAQLFIKNSETAMQLFKLLQINGVTYRTESRQLSSIKDVKPSRSCQDILVYLSKLLYSMRSRSLVQETSENQQYIHLSYDKSFKSFLDAAYSNYNGCAYNIGAELLKRYNEQLEKQRRSPSCQVDKNLLLAVDRLAPRVIIDHFKTEIDGIYFMATMSRHLADEIGDKLARYRDDGSKAAAELIPLYLKNLNG